MRGECKKRIKAFVATCIAIFAFYPTDFSPAENSETISAAAFSPAENSETISAAAFSPAENSDIISAVAFSPAENSKTISAVAFSPTENSDIISAAGFSTVFTDAVADKENCAAAAECCAVADADAIADQAVYIPFNQQGYAPSDQAACAPSDRQVYVPAGEEAGRVKITLAFGGVERTYVDRVLPEPDFTVTEEFARRRINASYEEKLLAVEQNLATGASPAAAILYSFPLFSRTVDEFAAAVECDAADATMEFRPYSTPKFVITRERAGYRVSKDRLYFDVYAALRHGREVRVEVRADVISPAVTAEQLARYTCKRSAFSTDYSRSNDNRKHNIRLALSSINGTEVAAGETFSFNSVVGSRTEKNGFREAKIILDGEYVEGIGGGVCQASTTVYNAALLAGMTVTCVKGHSLPPAYVPPSLDAMVNSGAGDLRFRNDGEGPVFIAAYGTDERAVVEFYGEKLPYRIVRESKVISKSAVPEDRILVDNDFKYVSPDMASGESVRVSYGSAGLTSEGYLCYYDDSGRLIDRKQIRRDVYRATRGLVALRP